MSSANLRELIEQRVAAVEEPFIVTDVTPAGESFNETFHILRDMVDEERLAHGDQGYTRV